MVDLVRVDAKKIYLEASIDRVDPKTALKTTDWLRSLEKMD